MSALHDIVQKGATDRSVVVRIIDSGDGTPETGVVWNTSGIDLWYRREGAAVTSITEATLAALTTAHADGGFLHIANGEYRLDLPDAAFATGANYVDFGGTVTGMIVIGGRVRLVDINVEDAVRGGLTALPNANAAASGGLYTRGTGAGQINQSANGQIDVNVAAMAAGTVTATAVATNAIDADALATDAVTEIVAGVFARAFSSAYSSLTFDEICKILLASQAGKASGMGTSTATIRNTADNADVIVATVDANGNRSAVTLTP